MSTATAPVVHAERDLRYGPESRHLLDVYRPEAAGPCPILVHFYGSNWGSNPPISEKKTHAALGRGLARAGLVVAVPDVRLFPEVRFPDFLHDCAAAVAFVQARAAALGGNADRLYLMGHSAGAYNVAMLTLDARYLAGSGGDAGRIAGMIGLSGPYAQPSERSPRMQRVFGAALDDPATYPVNLARGDAPPLLLLAGGGDERVAPAQSTSLAARMTEAGGRASAHVFPMLGHRAVLNALLPDQAWRAPVRAHVLGFVFGEEERPAGACDT